MTYEESRDAIGRLKPGDRLDTITKVAALMKAIEALELVVSDGCEGCEHINKAIYDIPCVRCKRNYIDYWEKHEH